MKILLLGATGRTGKHVLKTALDSGYQVNCLVRDPGKVTTQQNLQVFEGNPVYEQDLTQALADCNTIISVLNISRTSDFPWSSLRTPKSYLSDVMRVVLKAAESISIKRIVICSAWGVAETRKDIPSWFKWMIDRSNIGAAYADHERQERLLEASRTNWTIVRPVGLTNSSRKEIIQESSHNSPKPRLLISRRSVARFLVEAQGRDDLAGKKVVISKR